MKIHDVIDYVACSVAIWGLTRIYGRCQSVIGYEETCIACRSDRMCRSLEDIKEDLKS